MLSANLNINKHFAKFVIDGGQTYGLSAPAHPPFLLK